MAQPEQSVEIQAVPVPLEEERVAAARLAPTSTDAASLAAPDNARLAGVRGTTPLANQVAGHAGVMSDESGSLVIKPALPREIAFYQLIASAPRSSPMSALKPFLPQFFGTLRLGDQRGMGGTLALPSSADVPESIVLENLSYSFTHPCVLDAKLGTALYGPDATPEKAERMRKKAAETTTGEAGLRLTGCQTWHAETASFISTPRGFGYNLTVSRLPEGMVRFFPLPSDSLAFLSDDEAVPKQAKFENHALPAHLTLRVLHTLDAELLRLERALEGIELRAVGASVLVVYEGDAARLAQAFEMYDAKRVSDAARSLAAAPTDSDSDDEDDDDDEEESDSDEDDGVKADERRRRRCPPLRVRLIDFAHTWLAQGEGPDEGVLLGLRTLTGLVRGRIAEVEAYIHHDAGGRDVPVVVG